MRVLPLRLHALSKFRPAVGGLQRLVRHDRLSAPQRRVCKQRAGRCRRQGDESHAGSALGGHSCCCCLRDEDRTKGGVQCCRAVGRCGCGPVLCGGRSAWLVGGTAAALTDAIPRAVSRQVTCHTMIPCTGIHWSLCSGLMRLAICSALSSCCSAAAAAAAPAVGAAAPRASRWPCPCAAQNTPPRGCSKERKVEGRTGMRLHRMCRENQQAAFSWLHCKVKWQTASSGGQTGWHSSGAAALT